MKMNLALNNLHDWYAIKSIQTKQKELQLKFFFLGETENYLNLFLFKSYVWNLNSLGLD